jgi:Tetracyclin repressor-like, C-terminal domain
MSSYRLSRCAAPTIVPEQWRVDADLNAQASAPVLRAVATPAGESETLVAARTFVAWAQGFVSMELAGAFRLGGDVEAAFEYGLTAVLPSAYEPVCGDPACCGQTISTMIHTSGGTAR